VWPWVFSDQGDNEGYDKGTLFNLGLAFERALISAYDGEQANGQTAEFKLVETRVIDRKIIQDVRATSPSPRSVWKYVLRSRGLLFVVLVVAGLFALIISNNKTNQDSAVSAVTSPVYISSFEIGEAQSRAISLVNPGGDPISLDSYKLAWCAPPCASWTLTAVPLGGHMLPPDRAHPLTVCNVENSESMGTCNISTGVLSPIANSVVGLWVTAAVDGGYTDTLIDVVGDVSKPPSEGSDGWEVCGGARSTADGLGPLLRKPSTEHGVGVSWDISAGTDEGDCQWVV